MLAYDLGNQRRKSTFSFNQLLLSIRQRGGCFVRIVIYDSSLVTLPPRSLLGARTQRNCSLQAFTKHVEGHQGNLWHEVHVCFYPPKDGRLARREKQLPCAYSPLAANVGPPWKLPRNHKIPWPMLGNACIAGACTGIGRWDANKYSRVTVLFELAKTMISASAE